MFTKKFFVVFIGFIMVSVSFVFAGNPLEGIVVRPPVHLLQPPSGITPFVGPYGLAPSTLRAVYSLPSTGGSGTIAIIDAYDNPSIQNDFNAFSSQYGLPTATTTNFEIHKMGVGIQNAASQDWDLEECLDVEWAHAIAPNAKILFIEATSSNLGDMLAGVSYAANRSDVVAVSMSFGSPEFGFESTLDTTFISSNGASFFASAGDNGTGVEYPAASLNVIGVGGTLLSFGATTTETAWSGSGGGLSTEELEPTFQISYGVKSAFGFRAVPDVSYNGSSGSAVSVIDTLGYATSNSGWVAAYGTSAGAPQWAAIRALGGDKITNSYFYQVAGSPVSYAKDFRDITSGSNGTPGFYTTATTGYDYVTGLGSPLGTGLFQTGVENWKEQRFDLDISLSKE